MTDPERWEEVERLFDEVLELPPGERASWLAAAGSSPEVRREVESMLAGHDRAEGILETSVGALAAEVVTALDAEPAPPSLGPYRVIEEVGRGGMGVVYRAHDDRLRRDVALKLLPRHLRADARARERFLAEARAISALDHPNLCVLYDLGREAEQLYIVMAFYEGETVGRILERGPVPWRDAVDWARQAAEGLDRAHLAGVVHRDIKPDNLLVTSTGTVKILDFGVAVLEAGDADAPAAGTPAYMSPEQLAADGVDRRTDLWSLGVVLHEMLTGGRPFSGRDLPELRRAALAGPPAPLDGLTPPPPAGLQRVLDRLLAPDPEARYQCAAEVRADLEALLDRSEPPAPGFRRPRLPTPLTPCLGREREMEAIEDALREARLLTLTGPGGSGKTRLALEAAHRLGGRFRDGACFVPLGRLASADLLPSAIARKLEGAETAARSSMEGVLEALEHAEALLVLDNFEHLLEAAGPVTRLLAACPGLTVMVTSRVLLRVPGERSVVVPPLAVPQAGEHDPERLRRIPSVRLFVDRARSLDPRFVLDAGNARSVAELCRRLEGIPLALELAATRVHVLPPEALLERLGAALDLPVPEAQRGGDRHRTLREAIAWSHDLLEEPERTLLHRLAVASGFDLAAAEALAAAPTPTGRSAAESLQTLIDHSLVVSQRAAPGSVRFEMLELIRELAAERLAASGEGPEVRAAHAAHYLALAEELKDELTGQRQSEALDRLERDLPNLRATFSRSLETADAESALRMAAALWRVWMVRGPLREGERMLLAALDLPTARAVTSWRAEVLLGAANLTSSIGDPARARELSEEALEAYRLLGDARGEADALIAVGWLAIELSDLTAARRDSEAGRELARGLRSRRALALAENNLGWVALYEGRPEAATPHLATSLELRREIGDDRGVAYAQVNLAWAETLQGRLAAAGRRLDEARSELERLGDDLLLAWCLSTRGLLERWSGELERAEATLRQAIGLWRRIDHGSGLAAALTHLATTLNDQERWDEAEAAAGDALPLWDQLRSRWGRRQVLTALGDAAAGRGNRTTSRRHLTEAFTIAEQLGDGLGMVQATVSLARCSLADGDASRASTLLATAREQRAALGIRPSAPEGARERRLQQDIQQRLGSGRFRGIWRAGDSA